MLADTLATVAAVGTGLGLYVAALEGAQRTFLRSWFYAAGPGLNTPWYFMGRDWIDGLWAAGGLLLLSVFTILAARRLGPITWAAFGLNAISFVTRIGPAVNVWLHSSRAWPGPEAQSNWTSFEEYMKSQKAASDASLVVAVVFATCCLVLYTRALKREREASAMRESSG